MTHWALVLLGFAGLALRGLADCKTDLVPRTWEGNDYGCKCYLSDDCWPSQAEWDKLDASLDGKLLVNIPPEAVCHETFEGPLGTVKTYDQAACEEVQDSYLDEQWNVNQKAILLWRYFTNTTCLPTDDPTASCTLGFYGVYVIDAESKQDVQTGVAFACEHNLRLVIRNTGHDFIGRSTGWGGLVIRTHKFQQVEWIEQYSGPGNYSGRAVTVGAGVQGKDTLAKAHALDPPQALLVGECPTVGVAGGLIGGGGHGPYTPLKGLAADNVLSFDVITADGQFRTVNEDNGPDLFWALKGGGPGDFAVVLAATLKTWDDLPSAGAYMFINSTNIDDPEVFWEGVRIFHSHSNKFTENGLYVYFELGSMLLRVVPFVGINKSKEQLDALTVALRDELKKANVPFEYSSKHFPTFFELYDELFEPEAPSVALTGGWAFTHDDVESNNDAIVKSFRNAVSPREDLIDQGFLVGHFWDAGHSMPVANSATHPAFRQSTNIIITTLPVAENATFAQKLDLENVLTHNVDDKLREAGPNGCAYVNEADPFQPDWQGHFWGPLYPRLLDIKRKWDPSGLFYTVATPGSEDWETIEYRTRLCKKL